MIKITEKVIQSLLIDWSMQRGGHQAACPNVTRDAHPRVIDWEADLLTINRSGYLSEYEIKCSKSDYLKDSQKASKMQSLLGAHTNYGKRREHPEKIPNYFFYVTPFEIEPPAWAGWIRIEERKYSNQFSLLVVVEKKAPLLHSGRVGESQIETLARLLSYRCLIHIESYILMQRNSRIRIRRKKKKMTNHSGSIWMQEQLDYLHGRYPKKFPETKLSTLGVKVADFLGKWQRGIYHLDQKSLYKANWASDHHIEISIWCTSMSTYDYDDLTRLVFLAHQMALRVQIEPSTRHYMRMMFHERTHDPSDKTRRWCPTLEQAVCAFEENKKNEIQT